MKTILIRRPCYIYLFLLFMLCHTAVIPGQQTTNNTKDLGRKYTAFQAAIRAISQWESRDIEGIVDDCTAENLKQKNVNRKRSEDNLKIYITNRLSSRIDEDLRIIARNYFGNREETLFKEMKQKLDSKINKSIEENRKAKFPAIYEKSRKKAIDVQLDKLSQDIYPDPIKNEALLREFETAFLRGWKDQDCNPIKAKLRKKLESSEHMLEEVEGLKEEIVKKILRDIRLQMETQKGALEAEPPAQYITRSQLQNAIKREVIDAIERIRSDKIPIPYNMPYKGDYVPISKEINRVIYGIFKFVDEEIEARARAKEKSRFQEFCQGAAFNLWSREELERIIRNDLPAHKNNEKSVEKIADHYFSNAKQAIIREYGRKLLQTGTTERTRFEKTLQEYLADPGLENIVRIRLKSFLEGDESDLKAARNNIAKEQLSRYFPLLNNKTWEVPKLSKLEHRSKSDIMGEIKNKAGKPPENPEEFFKKPEYRELIRVNTDRGILLDNTDDVVVERVKLLIDEAGRAWDGQLSIYYNYREYSKNDTHHKINIRSSIKEKLMINPKLSKRELVDYYKKAIRRSWKEKRTSLIWDGAVPPYGPGKYKALFEHIEKEIDRMLNEDIEKVLKEIKDEQVKEKPPVNTKQSQKGNDPNRIDNETGTEPGCEVSNVDIKNNIRNVNEIDNHRDGDSGGDVCRELEERLIETQAKLRETVAQKNLLIWLLIGMFVLMVIGTIRAYKVLQRRKKWY